MDVSPDFAKLLVALAEAYTSVRLREGTFRLYWEGLKDLPLPAIEAAMVRAIKECDWFPTVSQLRKFVEPSSEDQAQLAWTAFLEAASSIGAYASLEVEDAAAAHALRVVWGGWINFCSAETHEMNARKAEFMAAYRDAKRRHTIDYGATLLPGLTALGTGRITKHGEVHAVQELRKIKAATVNRLIGDGHE